MDYEFYFDASEQRTLARVNPPHSAFGTWLSYELGADTERAELTLERLKRGQPEWELQGREWLLVREQDEILLRHHSLFNEVIDNDELKLDETALRAEAGPEDFEHLLQAWLDHFLG